MSDKRPPEKRRYRIDSFGAHENNNFQATDETQHYK